METWKKVFERKIPQEKYTMLLQNGEEKGLVVNLFSATYNVIIIFGAISAVRMIDEGVVLNGLFNDEQIDCFYDEGFENTIYQIEEGEFDIFVKGISGGLSDHLKLKHYIVISMNYVVEIITEAEPDIYVSTVG